MADYQSPRAETTTSMKRNHKKKRKLHDSEIKHEQTPSKSSRTIQQFKHSVNQPNEQDKDTQLPSLQDSPPYRHLQLILSLQDKNIDVQKKVELAYDFVKLSFDQVEDDPIESLEVISIERVIIFLNNWVQSTLISLEKKVSVSCLDYKCWEIFKFCLEEGAKLHVSMSFYRDILKVINCIAKNTEVKDFSDDELTLYDTVIECVSLVFVSHGGVSNENLDLWISLVGTVVELVLKVITNKVEDSRSGVVVLNLTCLVLEPFAKFLRLHPSKKSGFHDFVDRLLEPLLYLLHVTHQSVINANRVWINKLSKLNEEVLCQGLFHSSHIDGFLSLQSLTKYKPSDDGKQKDSKTVIKSYHRHLFDKLGRIVMEKKASALFGVGELFRLYVHCVKRQEGVDVAEGSKSFTGSLSEKSQHVSALSSEIRKSLFDFFVQVMEPFLGDIDTYLKDGTEVGSVLEDVHCTLKSVNSVLIGLIEEEVYLRVDDTSEGACGNFLKLICDKITLLSTKFGQIVPLTFDVNNGKLKESVEMAAKELVLCINYLLKIDYEVLGNDLESLWFMMFSYGTLGHTLTNMHDASSVISEIIHLGCHMVNLYSELRQVGISVFALCKAIRRLVSSARDIEVDNPESCRSLYHESWTRSLRLILCSPELRLSIHNAIKSIPEGQVSLCIKELATDLTESLEWMKGNLGNLYQDFKAEVLGSGLSEVYALILDSLMVTSGNSSLVGVSLNELMTVIRPILSILISQEDGVHKFLLEVSGCKHETVSAHWIFVFFFRLYLSSRSLYRQAISLAPPTTSKKTSEVMRDTLTAYSGNDWLEKTEKDEGYFSWISQSPVSLLFVIEAISDVYCKENTADISPLTYVLNAMVIQRLVDLNRLVNSLEFVIKRNENEDDIQSKKNKRLQKRLSKLTEEATGLVNVMTGHFSLLKECQVDYPCDIVVASIDKKSLPCAIWCIVCQNIDIWSMHAAKKKLKMFLSILLQSSLPYASSKHFGGCNDAVQALNLKTVTGREISLELLSNTMLYEEKFVRKHMASRFCKFLKELVSPLFSNEVNFDLEAHPNWSEVLNSLKIPSVSNNIKKAAIKQEIDLSVEMIYTVCETSFDFLSWMPKRCLSSKSFSLYATCILNLERFIVGALLVDHDDPSSCNRYKLLRLFLCCRRTLKKLMVTYCENNMESSQNSLGAIHFEGKFPALWLLESLLSVQHVFSKDENTHVNDLMFSLMDYTSYVFLTLTKGSFVHASHFLISSRKPFQQKAVPTFDQEDSNDDASNFIIHVADALKDHSQIMLTRESEKTSRSHLLRLSSIITCFQGFLWGLSSTLSHMDARNINLKAIFLRKDFKPIDKVKRCIDTFTSFIQTFLCELVLQDDKLLEASRSFKLEDVDMGRVHINDTFLSRVLAGENLEEAFFFRELFIAYAAILKLNLQTKTISLSINLVNIFVGISEVLLSEFSKNTETPSEFTFVFLDGIAKFLEELANHLSSTNPTLSPKVYEKLVDLHLKALGKCISLQQKRATLESHETESNTKTMNDFEFAYSSLDELKSRLRLSFKVYVSKPSELYISSAVQCIKKALIGLQEGCRVNYQIYTGVSSGGKVTSFVAAGIDCLDVVLEGITGRKGLSTVKTDILGSVCCLFNIIYHLQSPQIFYKNPISSTHKCVDPDPGSVVLMCIEVLTKVSGKHALYQMDACHVAQALSIPCTLFQNIFQLTTTSKDKNESLSDKLLDRRYSIELYAACCRMLYTFLRHHKRESLQHIALLQASVSVLLHCLEMVNKEETVQESYLVWGLQEGVKCGAFLRRIYEEIRQQKDVIGQDCRLFLSSYIVVYSGYGPLKAGIRREIDEALRPGVYALIDACSPDDLQYLHTVLGEGPCRNTLANLQHDYKINFQYEGKV